MNANSATKPGMMPIKNLAKNGPVGVLKPRCTIQPGFIPRSDISPRSRWNSKQLNPVGGRSDGSFPDKITGECVLFLFRGEDGCVALRARLGTQITPIGILQCHGDRNGILVASRGRHIVGLSPYVRKVPTAVGETEALWRALINLVAEPADAPERQSFELLRNDCPCEQRD